MRGLVAIPVAAADVVVGCVTRHIAFVVAALGLPEVLLQHAELPRKIGDLPPEGRELRHKVDSLVPISPQLDRVVFAQGASLAHALAHATPPGDYDLLLNLLANVAHANVDERHALLHVPRVLHRPDKCEADLVSSVVPLLEADGLPRHLVYTMLLHALHVQLDLCPVQLRQARNARVQLLQSIPMVLQPLCIGILQGVAVRVPDADIYVLKKCVASWRCLRALP